MKHGFFALLILTPLLFAGLALVGQRGAAARDQQIAERWIDANFLQIEINGKWEDIRLVPLADHLCKGNHPLFEKYCE